MKIVEEKYIVLKGSTAVLNNRPSASEAIIKMRNNLVKKRNYGKKQQIINFIFLKKITSLIVQAMLQQQYLAVKKMEEHSGSIRE